MPDKKISASGLVVRFTAGALCFAVAASLASALPQGNGHGGANGGANGGGGGGGGSDPPADPAITYINTQRSDLMVMNADGSNKTVVLPDLTYWFNPAFTADGSEILFATVLDGIHAVWGIGVDGTGLRQIAPMRNSQIGNPKASLVPAPDGNDKIVFSDPVGGGAGWDLFLVNPDGSGLQNLTQTPGRHEWYPSWAPGGDRIAVRVIPEVGDHGLVILELGLDAGGAVQVVGELAVTEVPGSPLQGADISFSAWANLNPWIVVSAMRDDDVNPDLWLIDLDDPLNPLRLTQTREREQYASFSPDDSVIVLWSGSLGVAQIDHDGSNILRLERKGVYAHRRGY